MLYVLLNEGKTIIKIIHKPPITEDKIRMIKATVNTKLNYNACTIFVSQ